MAALELCQEAVDLEEDDSKTVRASVSVSYQICHTSVCIAFSAGENGALEMLQESRIVRTTI